MISRLRQKHSEIKWESLLKNFKSICRTSVVDESVAIRKPFVVRSASKVDYSNPQSPQATARPSLSRRPSMNMLATQLRVNEGKLYYLSYDLEFKRGEIKEIRNNINDIRNEYAMFINSSKDTLKNLMEIVSDRFAKEKMMEDNNKLEIKQLQHHLLIAREMISKNAKLRSSSEKATVPVKSPSTSLLPGPDDNLDIDIRQMTIKEKVIMVKDDFMSIRGSFEKVQIFIQKFTNLHRVEMVHIKHMILKGLKRERQRTMRKNAKILIMNEELKTHRISKEKLNKLQINLKHLLNGLNNNMEIAFNVMNKMRNKNEVNINEGERFIDFTKQQKVFDFGFPDIDENENIALHANSDIKHDNHGVVTKKKYQEIKSGYKVYLKLLEKSMKQKKKYGLELDDVLQSTKEHRRLLKVKIADMEQVLKAMYHNAA